MNKRSIVAFCLIFLLIFLITPNANSWLITSKKISIQLNNSYATVNGTKIKLEAPATIIKGKTMVPLRFVSDAMDAKLDWDDKTKTANISTGKSKFFYHFKSNGASGISTDKMLITKDGITLDIFFIPDPDENMLLKRIFITVNDNNGVYKKVNYHLVDDVPTDQNMYHLSKDVYTTNSSGLISFSFSSDCSGYCIIYGEEF